MKAIIGAKFLASKEAQPRPAGPFEVRDTRLAGFILRVQPSGARSYYAEWSRGKRKSIGKVGQLTPDEARERCAQVLGNAAHGRDPLAGIAGGPQVITLGKFIADTYSNLQHTAYPKSAAETLARIELHFGDWYPLPLNEITRAMLDKWAAGRIKAGKARDTVMRDLQALSGVLTAAVEYEIITKNPVKKVKLAKVDKEPDARWLDIDEETRLRKALADRDTEMIAARASANKWRKVRNYKTKPERLHFGDHMTAAILVSMSTGVRRGELLALTWDRIRDDTMTIQGKTAKSSQTRRIPLTSEAVEVLKRWRAQCPDPDRVFPFSTGFKRAFASIMKRAQINRFRWHDIRHHFASRLVQNGVPLNTVRVLLGHASMQMVLRYAHLSPTETRKAIDTLMQPRVPYAAAA